MLSIRKKWREGCEGVLEVGLWRSLGLAEVDVEGAGAAIGGEGGVEGEDGSMLL